ncbi:DUF2628 domain-containing protein [Maritalea porphyrae]|jgi:hypothetical protein|uniref:DUF2628 domain-containing protein n=1 Tax=Maritalea porphyrae TaxID=880732 RepID=UPI0022AF29AE|nr:DUF2628 domain-containing protein [Maritalea porphyrae]MCZ4272238.1 DUF2628 domain-containing protein [Maritalea porphyrae]
MSLFAIYAKAAAADQPQTLAHEDVEVIRDRFSILACLLTPIWCIWHRLWLELVAYLGVAFVLGFLAFFVGEGAASWIGFLVAVLIGLEASAIRGYALTRKGYQFKGELISPNPRDAEWRYTAGQLNAQQTLRDRAEKPVQASSPGPSFSTTLLSNERPTGAVQ